MALTESKAIVGPVALIDGPAAFGLWSILSSNLANGLSLRQVVSMMSFSPEVSAGVLALEPILEDVAQRWRITRRAEAFPRGNDGNVDLPSSETRDPAITRSLTMPTKTASEILGKSTSRVRQLVRAGVLAGERGAHGWVLDEESVREYARRAA